MKPDPFEVDTSSYPAASDDIKHEETAKTRICLHHTAGNSADGAITTLRKPDYIMVHFLVDKDGTIYQFFPLKEWAFHLGVRELPKGELDRSSIGIEIVNVGPLVLKGNSLKWWPGNWNAHYCDTSDVNLFYQHPAWRGFQFSSTYTRAQYMSVGRLVAWLCVRESIQPTIWDVSCAYKLSGLPDFNGIFSHVNCRADKTDLTPAWNYSFFSTLLQTAYSEYKQNFSKYSDPMI